MDAARVPASKVGGQTSQEKASLGVKCKKKNRGCVPGEKGDASGWCDIVIYWVGQERGSKKRGRRRMEIEKVKDTDTTTRRVDGVGAWCRRNGNRACFRPTRRIKGKANST